MTIFKKNYFKSIIFYLRTLGKEEQTKPKASREKEINITVETSETENGK